MTDTSLAARGVALDLLRDVLRKSVPFDDAFDAHPELAALQPRDRGFVRLLVATVLRRLGQIDEMIQASLAKPGLPKAAIHDMLRLGTAQLVFLNTPAHAAVDTAVELAAARNAAPYKGLINAVLRRIGREGAEMAARQDAGRLNTPDWLWLSWRSAYGTARTRGIVEAHLHEAPLDITVKSDPEGWAERLGATLLPTGSLRRPPGGSVIELPGFDEGEWWIQDLAASLPAKLFGDLRAKRVFDLCAAPGGKTAQLVVQGAQVTAIDRSARRLERVTENLKRLRLEAEVLAADAATWEPEEPADAVLLDAPCSATGAIRRHPDILRVKTPDDIAKLARAQSRLLARSVELVKPGGTLIYCTCSIQPEEGEAQVARLLEQDRRVERWPVTADELGGLSEPINEVGEVRSLPGMLADLGGIDGFFVARLRRRLD
ncbi:methyltransferase domain-containing protein [Azospirillum oryzae]|uniref:Methyltransferase domain-containing protein n=1 Tax=Azospirillum oryzae TaxID=286727 RepID=A0A6N1AH94_9PROT|nr:MULTISPECIES: transcription antitermination factor NusB [Azospirillum]KAA0576001.1 methyltransferase domain-containing protein [Azospirillum sp. Sh1]KAA0589273.1 methyltransferase domain-containing protein [Azospirillum oryzae]QKS51115.1 methyltransferase domain-containing protein [Azospirillum oryzae]GLR79658.1 MFS transporter [Azospirillum oryzae]